MVRQDKLIMHTIDTIETDPAVKELNLTRAQLIDYCLDMMYQGDEEEKKEAEEKLRVLCPKRD
jgi:hypothetical protein